MKQSLGRLLKRTLLSATRLVGYRQSEQKIIGQAREFWHDTDASQFRAYSHWPGEQGVSGAAWLELGRQHMHLFDEFSKVTSLQRPLKRIIEWGCGGGSNAIHFAKETQQFVGVDVSQATLDECGNNLQRAGINNFFPVLIDVASPEAALKSVPMPCDLFLCTYVMELVPTPEYGKRIVDIAFKLLRPGGLAMIQIKYSTASAETRPRRWGYRYNAANMTTYPIDVFWELAQVAGFEPRSLTLRPKQELVGDERYAYYMLKRPNVSNGVE